VSEPAAPFDAEEVALVELVNRVLDRGALVTGEVVISVAGVDLVYLGLQLLLTSVETMDSRTEPIRRLAIEPPDDRS
jgi:gas vesicle structural protein